MKIFNLKKFLSVTVTLSLLLSAVPFNAQASSTTQNDILFNNTSIVKTNYGTVSDYVDIGSNITVINIQDLHCHLQTQRNINNILKDIDKAYPIDMLFVEGGYDNINFDTIDNISDKSFRTKIINKMLENGSLTGAEYFVLTNNKENILKGLDEKKLHEENLSKLAKIINKQELYSQIIKNISEEIKILNKKFLNKKNIQFSKILEKYKNGKISTGKFYKILLKYANESNKKQTFENILPLFVADYPNISNYLNISNINSDINLKKLNTQFQKFLSAVKQDLNYKEYKKLTDETNNFSDVFVFSDFITKYCEDKNIILKSNYSEIEKFVKDIKLKQNINPAKLLYEEQQLIKNVRLSLADDYTEYEISCISDLFTYFEKYLTYSLTAYEWQYFKENFDIFRKIYSKYSVADSTKNIENDFSLINSYYNINEERNNIFLEKIGRRLEGWKAGRSATTNINNRDPKEIIKGSNKIIVVVAGGFHSQDLKNELTAKKINSITIMPNITTETDTAKTEYENYVQMQNKMLSQALALRIFLSAPTYEQKIVFAKASLELLPEITKENLQTLEKILNIKIDILGDERYKFSFINTHGKRSEIIIDRIETTPEERKQINTEKNNISEIIDSVVLKLPTNTLKNISISDLGQIIRTVSLSKFNLFPLIEGIQPQAVENEEEFEPGKGNKIFEEIKERIDKDVPTKIAFVCLGNINRSAVAEVLFKSFLSKEDKNNIDVVSAGIDPRTPDGRSLDGKYSDPLNALKDIIDPDAMRNFKSESFGQKHLNSDYIIVASDDIRNIILKTHPEAKDRIIVFKEIVPDMSDRSSILDLTDDKFRAQLLVDLLKQFFEKFFEKRENEFKKMRENIKENIKNFFPSKQSFSKFYDKEDSDEPTPQKRFVSYKTRINKSFKMKIPQEIIDALHLDDGEEFYITRLKNNTLVVSKREEQLEELSNIFIRDKKSFRDKYLAQHIVYPRTYDVVLDKNNTVNMRKHYDPKISRTPLTEEEMSDINLYYDTRESLILEEKTEEKKKRTSILRNRSYFNRARLTLLAPKISSLRYLTLYRNILEKTYKITANILRNFGFKDKRPYFDIIYNSTNKKFLLSVINNRKKKIKYRLFAYMYLKTMKERNVIEDFEEFEDTLKLDFINYLKININKKRTFIKNNFDLRAVATGIFLLEDYFVEKERDRKEIYKKISKSIFVREGSTGIADEGMNFVSAHPLTIAHEIGHNILNTFGFTGYSKEETTLHELFADVIANCFGFEVGIEKNTTGYVLYGLFDNRCNEKIFQEEHEAARGFINLLKARSKAILDKEVSWQDLADAILDYVTNDRFLTERKKQIKSQKEILEDLFSEYFEKLYNNRTINDRDIA
ncbi:MAG: hypothetical protein II816_07330, partial [Elusimicrobia bacterium]|nr:hypothetical protein [Elusimicrobiota bacterium]